MASQENLWDSRVDTICEEAKSFLRFIFSREFGTTPNAIPTFWSSFHHHTGYLFHSTLRIISGTVKANLISACIPKTELNLSTSHAQESTRMLRHESNKDRHKPPRLKRGRLRRDTLLCGRNILRLKYVYPFFLCRTCERSMRKDK